MAFQFKSGFVVLAFVTLGCLSPGLGQISQPTPAPSREHQRIDAVDSEQLPSRDLPGNISGTVVDGSGAVVTGATVKLTRDQSLNQDALSGDNGQFSFANVAPGPFHLTITAAGFATQSSSGILHSGETYIVPRITMQVASAVTEVQVSGLSQVELAEQQIKAQEKQRVLGVLPNFYVSYATNPVPLTAKQKFEMAWRTTLDPVTIVLTGGIAGVQQAQNSFSGYGQGAQGYGKRFGASYADLAVDTFIGSAILPSILKQDPRYFYKGSGSKRSRFLYAMASSVICKGDNGRWQTNYSNILGSLAAGGISNLYYPAKERSGAGLTFSNALLELGAGSAANLFQEFLARKFTRNVPNYDPAKP
jgi:hypothetical protein